MQELRFELSGLFMVMIGIIALFELGMAGRSVNWFFQFLAGNWKVLLILTFIGLSIYLMMKRNFPTFWNRKLLGFYLVLTSILVMSHGRAYSSWQDQAQPMETGIISTTWSLVTGSPTGAAAQGETMGGGMIGALIFSLTHALFSVSGSYVVAGGLMITGIIFMTGRTFIDIIRHEDGPRAWVTATGNQLKRGMTSIIKRIKDRKTAIQSKTAQSDSSTSEVEPEILDFTEHVKGEQDVVVSEVNGNEPESDQNQADTFEEHTQEGSEAGNTNIEPKDPAAESNVKLVVSESENKEYHLPPFDLLKSQVKPNQSKEHSMLSKNARKLEETLDSFGVKAKVTKVHLGPSVTKYEVYPNAGVKVSKIVNLTDDLALALAAKDIRMEAPIPGKSAIGIEVPNQEVSLVTLREVLESALMKGNENPLAIGLGRDISGEAVIAELNKMPHLLVAGATGSGKSVCINGIIISILLRAKPHEVKLMMIDPKMVELNVYNGIPHLLAPVVTEPKKAAQALKKVVSEMERRYELFAASGTRNLEGYNEYIRKENLKRDEAEAYSPLPYIVVIVDELADLMMVASSEVEDAITRLAQMARAAGIHLIIATQRPSVDVITGVIKANIPSRIAFGVSSSTDSRTILDGNGAEKLLGKGDMLFIPVGASKSVRIQGAFLSDDEVERIVNHCIEQQKAQYAEEMIPSSVEEQKPSGEADDELYPDAVALVRDMQSASVSMMQRRFRVGYARAARLIDEMEVRGIVGPYEGSKPREVLVSKDEDPGPQESDQREKTQK
nr:DNA translocase FtsK [Salisediminibacterium beveridgei]